MENRITRRFKINVPKIYSLTLTYVEYIMRNARLETEMGVTIVKRKWTIFDMLMILLRWLGRQMNKVG